MNEINEKLITLRVMSPLYETRSKRGEKLRNKKGTARFNEDCVFVHDDGIREFYFVPPKSPRFSSSFQLNAKIGFFLSAITIISNIRSKSVYMW
jgi:hypothetical protein